MRPDTVFDRRLQHERTALAWERTAIAMIVAGALLARHAVELSPMFAIIGIAQLLTGASLLIWTGRHYDDLHAPLRRGESPVHPGAARLVGVASVVFCGSATAIAIAAAAR
ncbi:MAG: DUF202 domain-containing protein [Ilumatobacter sp.]|nr:DUF202 domain-containing protein [Ilumatobacter sp.]